MHAGTTQVASEHQVLGLWQKRHPPAEPFFMQHLRCLRYRFLSGKSRASMRREDFRTAAPSPSNYECHRRRVGRSADLTSDAQTEI